VSLAPRGFNTRLQIIFGGCAVRSREFTYHGNRRKRTLIEGQGADECPVYVCAVRRRRFPVGASPTRRTLQPEATGAVMEVTKWLKPSV
jgi:hypothetical protein